MLELKEKLSEYAHIAWSGWMGYLFSKCNENEDGTMTIPKWAVDRWKRQASTPYNDLTEEEKESDRSEAQTMLGIVDYQSLQSRVEKLEKLLDRASTFIDQLSIDYFNGKQEHIQWLKDFKRLTEGQNG